MIEELQQLSQAIGTLKISDAGQVVNAVNRRLEALLHPLMIKLYWRQEAEGGVILNPIAHIDNTGGSAPQRFQMQGSVGGMLSWVYQNEEPMWIENIRNLDLQQPAKNRLTGKDLPSDFLLFRPEIDSSMVIPLNIRGATYGVYSIELAQSNRLTLSVLDLLKRLGNSLALIIWNADTYEFNQDQTNRAINRFLDSIRDFAFDSAFFLGENYRSGFVARPFTDEFADVQETLNNILKARGIEARHYEPDGGSQYMIDEIMNRIRTSHFCVADITGSNANVLAEVGMMMILQKRFLLLRRKGDDAPRPFNLNQYPLYEYEIKLPEGEMNVWSSGDNKFQSFATILDKFTAELPPETGFFAAQKSPS